MHESGCVVCGRELVYDRDHQERQCLYCCRTVAALASCPDGHFVCDACHGAPALDLIETVCREALDTDAARLADRIMGHPSVKMHGPEHHYLVPAVLLTALANATGRRAQLDGWLAQARRRSAAVLGGFCGSHGACGAALGVGIFWSVHTGATPLSQQAWQDANAATAQALAAIAREGGPRCCKRDTFLALREAAALLAGRGVTADETLRCRWSQRNRQCRLAACPLHAADGAHCVSGRSRSPPKRNQWRPVRAASSEGRPGEGTPRGASRCVS